MTVLQTSYLIGLAGLLVPVIIHLWSRKNRTPIPFGSIRFITSSAQRALRKIVPSDPWMLLLRSLIVLFLVLLLSDFRVEKWTAAPRISIYVDSAYATNQFAQAAIEKASDTAEVIWLQKVAPNQRLGYWKTLKKEDAIIFSPWNPDATIDRVDDLYGLDVRRFPSEDLLVNLGIASIKGNAQKLSAILSETSISIERSETDTEVRSLTYYFQQKEEYDKLGSILSAAFESINEVGLYQLREVSNIADAELVISADPNEGTHFSKKLIWLKDQIEPWTEWSKDYASLSFNLNRKSALESELVSQLYRWLNPYSELVTRNDIRLGTIDFQDDASNLRQDLPRSLAWVWWSLLLIGIGIERWFALK